MYIPGILPRTVTKLINYTKNTYKNGKIKKRILIKEY